MKLRTDHSIVKTSMLTVDTRSLSGRRTVMERFEYETTVSLLGIECGITVVYEADNEDDIYIDVVYGPSGKNIYPQLVSRALCDEPELHMLDWMHPQLGRVPHRLRWVGRTEIDKLHDEVLYAHRSGW